MMEWRHVKTAVDGNCNLFGINVFDYPWNNTNETIQIHDPLYHQPYQFTIWKITANGIIYTFAAGEFSNCIWGFYLPEQ